MTYIWEAEYRQWDKEQQTYKPLYTLYHSSHMKARKAIIDHMHYVRGEKDHTTNDYSKGFFSITSGSGETHCIVKRHRLQR